MLDSSLSEDTQDFWIHSDIQTLDNPAAIEFMKQSVNKYHPIKIKNAVNHWKALKKWNKEYFIKTLGSKHININLTPDGHGDCIKYMNEQHINNIFHPPHQQQQHVQPQHIPSSNSNNSSNNNSSNHNNNRNSNNDLRPYFLYPAEKDMNISEFFELLESKSSSIVPYLSQQNDNIRTYMPELLNDIDISLSLADEVFSDSISSASAISRSESSMEAMNLWIGDERSVSSLHKDHFENMYVVISGEKTFTLLPPTDIAFLPEIDDCPTLKYQLQVVVDNTEGNHTSANCSTSSTSNQYHLILSQKDCPTDKISWIPLDPNVYINNEVNHYNYPDFPKFKYAHPIQCTVHAGEILYIPAMWYHRVSQTCLTISVNYWYEQDFDFRFVFYQTIKRMKVDESSKQQVHKYLDKEL